MDRTWAAELERLARRGDLEPRPGHRRARAERHAGGALPRRRARRRRPQRGGVERRQADALRAALAAGAPRPDDHVELHLPGDVRLVLPGRGRVCGRRHPGARRRRRPRRRATAQRQAQRFADLMAVMPGGVAVLDPAGRIVSANPGLCALLGAPAEQLRGMAARSRWPPSRRRAGSRAGCGRCRPAPSTATASRPRRCCAADGTTVWCELDVTGTPRRRRQHPWLMVVTDVSERRRAAELLRRAGTVDELTRLPNRAACLELLDRLLVGPDRERVAVVCGGLDDFQRVNSSLGHEAGDDLLVTLAGRLQRDLPVGCTRGAAVRRRVRRDLRRPRRGGRPRPARRAWSPTCSAR